MIWWPGTTQAAAPGPRDPLPGDHAEPADLRQELLNTWARQPWHVPVPVVLAACGLAWLPSGPAPLALRLGWVLLVVSVLSLRWWVIRGAARQTLLPMHWRFNTVALVSGLGGVAHGLSVLLWPFMTEPERVVQSIFVLGLSAGAVATTCGYLRLHLPYMLAAVLPMAVSWCIVLRPPSQPWWQGSGGVLLLMMLLYMGLLTRLDRDTFKLYADSFQARLGLMAALRQAESASRAKTRFLAAASHDLRQPMHTLSLFGAALSTRPLDAQSRTIADQMNTALRALSSELDALLDISKLDAGVVDIDAEAFELSHLLERLARDFKPLAQHKGLQLGHQVAPDAWVHSDQRHIERVLRNLLDNAVKYTRRGEVGIRLQPDARAQPGWRVEVHDSGPGIPAAEHARVFEEFYQIGNAERDRTQGLGLGLAIVHRLCELLKVPIKLESAPGQGTVFSLWIPAAAEAAIALAARPAPRQAAAPSFAGLDVLVVDDEAAIRLGMRELLQGLGCHVHVANGSAEALARAQETAPDLVLADLRLQDQDDGIAVIAQLRQRHGPLPALLISGDTAPERLREAQAAGLKLLHKPLTAEDLTRAMRDVLHAALDHGPPR